MLKESSPSWRLCWDTWSSVGLGRTVGCWKRCVTGGGPSPLPVSPALPLSVPHPCGSGCRLSSSSVHHACLPAAVLRAMMATGSASETASPRELFPLQAALLMASEHSKRGVTKTGGSGGIAWLQRACCFGVNFEVSKSFIILGSLSLVPASGLRSDSPLLLQTTRMPAATPSCHDGDGLLSLWNCKPKHFLL